MLGSKPMSGGPTPVEERDWKRAALAGLAGRCPSCGQDWRHQRADDFPAYLVVLAVGHVIVPSFILAKGAVIGVQWALAMDGFAR